MKINLDAIKQKSDIAKKTAETSNFSIAIVGTLCFLIAFNLLVNLPNNIANPIKELTQSIKQIANKNYSERVHFTNHNEYGDLAKSFNTMAQKLQEYNNSSLYKLFFEKKRLETLINNMNDPIIGLDNEGIVLFANDEALKIIGLKLEDVIGKPLSPYAVTKYVNELYADVFSKTYGMETIGLRYFNVFGRNQDPNGAYAAVIPKFVAQFLNHESPVINGDGNFSRDFTYIDNVIQMNELAMLTENKSAINTVYNTAFGERTTLNELVNSLREFLSTYDNEIANVPIIYGENRVGDIPHSLASIEKAKKLLNYQPKFSMREGLKEAVNWYWNNLKK